MEFDSEVLHFYTHTCNEGEIVQIIKKLNEYRLDVLCHRYFNDFEFFVVRNGLSPSWSDVQIEVQNILGQSIGLHSFSLMNVHIVVNKDKRLVFKNYGTGNDVVVEENFGI